MQIVGAGRFLFWPDNSSRVSFSLMFFSSVFLDEWLVEKVVFCRLKIWSNVWTGEQDPAYPVPHSAVWATELLSVSVSCSVIWKVSRSVRWKQFFLTSQGSCKSHCSFVSVFGIKGTRLPRHLVWGSLKSTTAAFWSSPSYYVIVMYYNLGTSATT